MLVRAPPLSGGRSGQARRGHARRRRDRSDPAPAPAPPPRAGRAVDAAPSAAPSAAPLTAARLTRGQRRYRALPSLVGGPRAARRDATEMGGAPGGRAIAQIDPPAPRHQHAGHPAMPSRPARPDDDQVLDPRGPPRTAGGCIEGRLDERLGGYASFPANSAHAPFRASGGPHRAQAKMCPIRCVTSPNVFCSPDGVMRFGCTHHVR